MTATIIALAAIALLLVLRKRTPRWLARHAWAIHALLALIAGAAAVATPVGRSIAGWIGGALGWAGGWFGTSASIVAGLLVLLLFIVVVADLSDKVADTPAITSLMVLPLLCLTAGGPIAEMLMQVYGQMYQFGDAGLGNLLGG